MSDSGDFVPSDNKNQLGSLSTRACFLVITFTWFLIFLLRMTGPPELLDNDQQRPAAYMMDVLINHNWIIQWDPGGDIASKPPMWVWMASILALLTGGANLFSLYFPGAAALLVVCLVTWRAAERYLGRTVGLLAALIQILSWTGFKQVYHARTDTVFTMFIVLGAVTAWMAAEGKWRWTWFWLAAALATLTKGPLGLVLAAGGLIAFLPAQPRWKTWVVDQLPGVALYLVLCGGWLFLAWRVAGVELIQKQISSELIGHAVPHHGDHLWEELHLPVAYFFARFVPWSFAAAAGVWMVWRGRHERDDRARFLRYTACFLLFGLVLFTFASHHRPDHLFPLIPAGAILASHVLAAFVPAAFIIRARRFYPATVALLLVFNGLYNWLIKEERQPLERTEALIKLTREIKDRVGANFPLVYTDAPFAMQYNLGTAVQSISNEEAVEALESDHDVFIVVQTGSDFGHYLQKRNVPYHVVARGDAEEEPFLLIISNHPKLEWTDKMITYANGVEIAAHDARVMRVRPGYAIVRSSGAHAHLTLTNESETPVEMKIQLGTDSRPSLRVVLLRPKEQQEVACSPG